MRPTKTSLLAAVVGCVALAYGGWEEPIKLSDNAGGWLWIMGGSPIAVDPAGNVHVVWSTGKLETAANDVYYRQYSVNQQTWLPIEKLNQDSVLSEICPVVATDGLGTVHVIWCPSYFQGTRWHYDIYYRRHQPGGWQPIEVIAKSTEAYATPLVANQLGNVHVVWDGTESSAGYGFYLWHRWWNSETGNWTPVESLSVAKSRFPQAIVDQEGNLDLVYEAGGSNNWKSYYRHWSKLAKQWESPFQLEPTGYSSVPWVTVDTAANLHFVWAKWDLPDKDLVRYRMKRASDQSWTEIETFAECPKSDWYSFPHLAVDNNQNFHCTWYGEDAADIHYRFYSADSGQWNPDTVLVSMSPWYYSAMAVDHLGNLHFVYTQGPENTPSIWYRRWIPPPAAVADDSKELKKYLLAEPSPNPSAGLVRLIYQLRDKSFIALSIYNPAGRLVRRLVRATQPAGSYSITWNGRDDLNHPIPAGIYFCRLETPGVKIIKKIVLVKKSPIE